MPKESLGNCCKGFDSSAAIGDWVPVEKLGDIQKVNFHLNIDGKTVQQGNTADMLFSVDQIIAYVSRFCTLKIGDLLFTGTPVGVGPVQIGNHLEGFLENGKNFLIFTYDEDKSRIWIRRAQVSDRA